MKGPRSKPVITIKRNFLTGWHQSVNWYLLWHGYQIYYRSVLWCCHRALVVFNFCRAFESMEELLKIQMSSPHPQPIKSESLGWDWGVSIFKSFPGDFNMQPRLGTPSLTQVQKSPNFSDDKHYLGVHLISTNPWSHPLPTGSESPGKLQKLGNTDSSYLSLSSSKRVWPEK